MTQLPHPIRFVEHLAPRAKPIPRGIWEKYKDELCLLYQSITLEEVMVQMKYKHGFEPSRRQYIFQFEKWGFKKYNTCSGRDIPSKPLRGSQPLPERLSSSAPEKATSTDMTTPNIGPKRPKSMGSLQSKDSARNSIDGRPAVPPKKRQKLAEYMAARESVIDPFADPLPDTNSIASSNWSLSSRSRGPPPPARPSSSIHQRPASTIHQLASLGLQFASTGQPGSSNTSPLGTSSPHSNSLGTDTNMFSNTPGLVEDDSDWMTVHDHSDSDMHLPEGVNTLEVTSDKPVNSQLSAGSIFPRRRFDSSRPIHTFSQEELGDMKMASHFLRSLGFDSDAFELFTIMLKHLKEPNSQPAWMKSSALINCVRSAYWSPQMDIARTELFKTLEEPRDASTDAEQFLYRMLLAETYTRSDEKENEDFLSEIAIGCELASDRMLDRLPDEHRCYDILTYHYLNKCLEYLNAYVKDSWDQGTVFTDKAHLQIRLVERVPGPFELRRGSMGNPCLRSCLQWCCKQLESVLTLPDSWKDLQSNDGNYIYWTDHIGLYCALWNRWQTQRRDFGALFELWMLQTEERMGITPAELLSVTCGVIMSAAPPRLSSETSLIMRARNGVHSASRLLDKDLACQFLDTFSLLGTLLGSAPQRQYHDPVSFFATLINSTSEREAFGDRARAFSRRFIERDLNCILPTVQRDIEPPSRRSAQLSFLMSGSAMQSIENLASVISPFFASSIHSSELSAMRSLRDQIQQATRRSVNHAIAAPSTVARAANRSYVSIPTISDLSQAMASTLSLTASQRAANAALDAIAASSRDVIELLAGWEGYPGEDGVW